VSVRSRRLVLFAIVVSAIAFAVVVGSASLLRSLEDPGSRGDRSLLRAQSPEAIDATRASVTDGLHGYGRTVRVDHTDVGLELDATGLDCHGGMLQVVWHVGNLEPTVPDTGIHLSARLDDEVIGSLIVGSTRGVWEDGPAAIHAATRCPTGGHELKLTIVSITGAWGIPYVGPPGAADSVVLRVNRGFVATEYWNL
jgi:hypothetical protein